jgi:hypothetical protein
MLHGGFIYLCVFETWMGMEMASGLQVAYTLRKVLTIMDLQQAKVCPEG